MTEARLAAILDGQVVVLDTATARLMLMDPQTERVWRSCSGVTLKELATELGGDPSELASTLEGLAAAGLVTCLHDRWTGARVAWV